MKMKQALYSLILVCTVCFISCKKEHSKTINTSTLHKVSFHVGFLQQIANLKTHGLVTNAADTSVTNHISVLAYAVYNSSGLFLHQVKQSSTDSNFGTYTDNLAPGNYTVAIAGGGPNLSFTANSSSSLTPVNLSTDVLGYVIGSHWSLFQYDTFFKKVSITVGDADISQSVSLNRIASKLIITIQDAIPANVKSINFAISNASDRFAIATETTLTNTTGAYYIYKQLAPADIGKTNYQITQLFLYQVPLAVDMYASTANISRFGDKTGATAEKVISNVTGAPNTVTMLNGNLFGGAGAGGSSFALKVDTAWDPTPIIKSFP